MSFGADAAAGSAGRVGLLVDGDSLCIKSGFDVDHFPNPRSPRGGSAKECGILIVSYQVVDE